MGSSDKLSRQYSVPVRGGILGHNYWDQTERDLSMGASSASAGWSDIAPYFYEYVPLGSGPVAAAPAQYVPIRILKPHYGELTECYVDLDIVVAAADANLTLKLAVGRFTAGTNEIAAIPTVSEIDASWRQIHGSTAGLPVSGGRITADLINLLPVIPPYGHADYRRDMFVLILAFNKIPTITGTFDFNYFNIHTSVSGAI